MCLLNSHLILNILDSTISFYIFSHFMHQIFCDSFFWHIRRISAVTVYVVCCVPYHLGIPPFQQLLIYCLPKIRLSYSYLTSMRTSSDFTYRGFMIWIAWFYVRHESPLTYSRVPVSFWRLFCKSTINIKWDAVHGGTICFLALWIWYSVVKVHYVKPQ